jgi:hypothetical protein
MAVIDSIPNRDGQVVANCICHVAGTNPNKIDNAQLIAAAPDLLAACEAALRIEELWMPFEWDDPDEAAAVSLMRDLFVAAIAKAKGQSA